MHATFGNVAAKEGFYEDVKASDPDLYEIAARLGVHLEDGDGEPKTDERIAAECSGVVQFRPLPGKLITKVGHPGGTLMEFVQNITKPIVGVWDNHSFEPPAWVEADSEGLAQILSDHYNCPIGRPDDWED